MREKETTVFGRLARVKRTRLVMLGGGVAFLAALLWMLSPGRPSPRAATHEAPADIAVDATPAVRSDVPVYLDGLGAVQAFYTVKVNSRVDGELNRVAFVEGQQVKRGDLLAEIDPRPYQAALDQAIAARAKDTSQLANAKLDLQRYIVLAPQDLASKQQLDTQKALVGQLTAQIEADQAAIESARTELDYCRITSPINGLTGLRLVDPGNIVHATDTTGIVVLTQMQPIAVIFTLPEDTLPEVQEAMSRGAVSVTAIARGGQKQELDRGTLSLVDNQIDQTTATIRLKATFANPKLRLWPGEFVNARVLARTEKNVLTIPAAALQRGPDGTFAYVVQPDSTVQPRPITVGNNSENVAVVESGLKEGDRVVTSNLFRLQPGAHVRVNSLAAATSS
jgi:membrane fusion protein, multidrug efflux system